MNTGCNLEWADLFTPVPYSSASRAQAFLWLCYHYLESTFGNPYADEFASTNPGLAPQLVPLGPEAMATENVDTSDELAWGVEMAEKRLEFLAKIKAEKEQEELEKARAKEQDRERLIGGLTGGHPKSTARRTSPGYPNSGISSRPRKGKQASSSSSQKLFGDITTRPSYLSGGRESLPEMGDTSDGQDFIARIGKKLRRRGVVKEEDRMYPTLLLYSTDL